MSNNPECKGSWIYAQFLELLELRFVQSSLTLSSLAP